MVLRPAVTVMVAVALVGAGGLFTAAAPPPPAFDAAAAARYLDRRMDLWWQKAKPLATVNGETKCLSCHTAVPYALARPVLGRMLGSPGPTAHQTTIVAMTRTRVAHLDRQQPYYDHTEAKKTESRGVEAVLNALVLTSHERESGAAAPEAATVTAMARLWDVQRADGAWDWLDFALEPYETSDAVYHGATLAAMAAGTPTGRLASATAPGTAGVERLRGYLRAHLDSQHLFNRTWALLASSRLPDLLTADERTQVVGALAAAQREDGGWSLAGLGDWHWSRPAGPYAAPGPLDAALVGASDGYATGLVVHALREAGFGAHPAVARGRTWLVTHQQPERADDPAWAPWRAHSLNFDREHGGDKGEPWRRLFMSDLATAFAVLALQ